jgi:hypothetical protein
MGKLNIMKKTFSLLLKIAGVLFFVIAVLCAWGALNSFLERSQHGTGLMFADAEIFTILTVVFLILGFIFLWAGKKLKG